MAQKYWTAEDLAAAGYAGGHDEVYSITDAESRQSESVEARAKSYAFKMFLRIVCIIAAVMVDGVWQWVFLAGAAVIPWLAVVVANGNSRQHGSGFSAFLPEEQQLAIAAAQADRAARTGGSGEPDGAGDPGDTGSKDGGVQAPAPQQEPEVLIIDGEIIEPGEDSARDRKAEGQ